MQYDWSQPISTSKIDVYWWDDRQGVRLPKACRLLYWDGNAFVPVANASGLGVAGNQFNTTTFDEVRTAKLRLEIDSNGTYSTGILEWKVYDSGKSPDFPPMVTAGIDRVVVLGGKTYLAGTVQDARKADGATATWSKASGPGTVTFADAKAAVTTATFSQTGRIRPATDGRERGVECLVHTDRQGRLAAAGGPAGRGLHEEVQDRQPAVERAGQGPDRELDSPLHRPDQPTRISSRARAASTTSSKRPRPCAAKPHGRHKGYVFSNAWVHQTVESMCIALMVDPQGDPEIIKAQERMQGDAGGLDSEDPGRPGARRLSQTAYTLADRNRWPERWSPRNRGDHEGYVAGYFIESAINHYTLTNGTDKRLYDAAKKLADCWVANLGPAPKKAWYDGHQEMEQALVRFGRFVNDMEGPGSHGDSYIKLAKFLLDCRKDGSEYDQSHVPVSSSTRRSATRSAPSTPTPAWPTWPRRPTTSITRAPS